MKNSILKFPLILFGIALFSLQVSCQNNSKKSANSNKKEVAVNTVFPKAKSNTEWQKELTPAQYQVMVKKGTERAFENPYFNNHKKGVYVSAATGEPMFSSDTKFNSGTGWPSFTAPINDDAVIWVKDNSMGMSRDEIIEKSTGLHLGHVFNDGPAPTHLRYCMNSAALKFIPEEQPNILERLGTNCKVIGYSKKFNYLDFKIIAFKEFKVKEEENETDFIVGFN